MSFRSLMVNFRHALRAVVFPRAILACAILLFLAALPAAQAQFTVSAGPLQPSSVDPGGSATSILTLTYVAPFAGTVDFTCTVTSTTATSDLPACGVSPLSETASSLPSLTLTTSGLTLPGTYQVVVTGTSGATSVSATIYLNVADLQQDYTVSVYPPTAIPSPVVAGSTATTTVTVAPIGGYTGTVTLSCLSVTPVVTGAPVCSFTPSATLKVTGGTPPSTTLTLTTFTTVVNPPTPNSLVIRSRRMLYALWLGIPSLAFVGLGASGKRNRKLLGIFLLLTIACGLFLLPACGNNNSNNAANQITPNNTYTFTLTGSDLKGLGPSSTSEAMVTLEVTTPK